MKRWVKNHSLQTMHFSVGANEAPVPPAFQTQSCSCGAAALKSVLKYWGVFNGPEQTLIQQLKTNYSQGTRAKEISKIARLYGLTARIERKMSINSLSRYVSEEIPVICPIQAWAIRKREYRYEEMLSGHYVVVVGVSEGHVIFQDPLLWGYRGALPEKDFHNRWKDWDWDGTKSRMVIRLGIPISADWKPVLKVDRSFTKIIP